MATDRVEGYMARAWAWMAVGKSSNYKIAFAILYKFFKQQRGNHQEQGVLRL